MDPPLLDRFSAKSEHKRFPRGLTQNDGQIAISA